MSLEEYQAKRNFQHTPEPRARRGQEQRQAIFVVQEHHASHFHYDFRLEADGVLKSWAVPKGPSMDPAQKRLAVHVEDHPLEYADFKGTIPAGQYGAGTVAIWDRGTYDNLLAEKPRPQSVAEGVEAGQLEFALNGKKLRGRFALIRMQGNARGKDNWLLIKMKDELAQPQADGAARPSHRGKADRPATATTHSTQTPKPPPSPIEFTNTDKLIYPQDGITKGDVIEFYRRIAPRLLPFLRDRPVTLERLPDGLGKGRNSHFWQKNTPDSYPDWVPRVALPTEEGKTVHYALVNNLETLLYLVNQGTLTFHTWSSRVQDLDRPDFVLFDLDPGRAAFADAVAVAKTLHQLLKGEAVEAYVKTSGKTGLHILVPWEEEGGFEAARALAMAQRAVESMPKQATVERSKAKRGRRLYIDVMQNARGLHAVPPYVLRAVPGARFRPPCAGANSLRTLIPVRSRSRPSPAGWCARKAIPSPSYLLRGVRRGSGFTVGAHPFFQEANFLGTIAMHGGDRHRRQASLFTLDGGRQGAETFPNKFLGGSYLEQPPMVRIGNQCIAVGQPLHHASIDRGKPGCAFIFIRPGNALAHRIILEDA